MNTSTSTITPPMDGRPGAGRASRHLIVSDGTAWEMLELELERIERSYAEHGNCLLCGSYHDGREYYCDKCIRKEEL